MSLGKLREIRDFMRKLRELEISIGKLRESRDFNRKVKR